MQNNYGFRAVKLLGLLTNGRQALKPITIQLKRESCNVHHSQMGILFVGDLSLIGHMFYKCVPSCWEVQLLPVHFAEILGFQLKKIKHEATHNLLMIVQCMYIILQFADMLHYIAYLLKYIYSFLHTYFQLWLESSLRESQSRSHCMQCIASLIFWSP